MGFGRCKFEKDGRMPSPLRGGDGFVANIRATVFAAETDETITIDELSGGVLSQGTTLTSDVTYTTPTAALILDEFDTMDVGDHFTLEVINAQAGAFDVIIAGGTGVTLQGANNVGEVAPKGSRMFHFEKASATTINLY